MEGGWGWGRGSEEVRGMLWPGCAASVELLEKDNRRGWSRCLQMSETVFQPAGLQMLSECISGFSGCFAVRRWWSSMA